MLIAASTAARSMRRHLLGKKTRSLALPLVDETDNAFIANLLQPDPAPDDADAASCRCCLPTRARSSNTTGSRSHRPSTTRNASRGVVEAAHIESTAT